MSYFDDRFGSINDVPVDVTKEAARIFGLPEDVVVTRCVPYKTVPDGGVVIELKDGESGYEAVRRYIRRYWSTVGSEEDVLFTVTFEDGSVATSIAEAGPIFVDDWWGRQKRFAINGICNISKCRITGGIYPENPPDRR